MCMVCYLSVWPPAGWALLWWGLPFRLDPTTSPKTVPLDLPPWFVWLHTKLMPIASHPPPAAVMQNQHESHEYLTSKLLTSNSFSYLSVSSSVFWSKSVPCSKMLVSTLKNAVLDGKSSWYPITTKYSRPLSMLLLRRLLSAAMQSSCNTLATLSPCW